MPNMKGKVKGQNSDHQFVPINANSVANSKLASKSITGNF